MDEGENPLAECEWDPHLVGLLVAGLVKSLVQARWKGEPGFLPDADLAPWFRAGLAELRDDARSAGAHLQQAVRNVRRLQEVGFLPRVLQTSCGRVGGLPCAAELVSAVEQLLAGNRHLALPPIPAGGAGEENPVAVLARVDGSPARHSGWERGIDWGQLPQIRPLVDEFLKVPAVPAVKPRWDPVGNRLWYGTRLARVVSRGASNIRELLGAFEAAGWPMDPIGSPFGGDAEALHNTLKRLRKSLELITFGSESGVQVKWWPVPRVGPPA